MTDVSTWDPLDDANTAAPPAGWPEFMMPSMVNNSARAMMGAVRRMYDQQISGAIVLPYLKLVGGQTVTGAVTFSAGITASSIVSNSTIAAAGNIVTSGSVSGVNIAASATVSGASVAASGNVFAAGYLIGGTSLAAKTGGLISFHDGGGTPTLALDNAGTGSNYYINTSHYFRNRANSATFLTIDSGGLTVAGALNVSGGATLGGAIVATGAITSNRADELAFYAPNGGITCALDISGRNLIASGNANISGNVNVTGGSINITGSGGGGDLTVAQVLYAHDVMPSVDNVSICGGAASAWNVVEAYNFVTKSDVALKTGIGPLPDTLPLVAALAPKAFQYDGADDRRHWGFVAQDVRAAVSNYPVDLVSGEEGRLGLDYGGLTAMLWKAVQELAARLTVLEGGGE